MSSASPVIIGLCASITSTLLFFSGLFAGEILSGCLLCAALMLGCAQVLHMLANRTRRAGGWGAPVLGVLLSLLPITLIARTLDRRAMEAGDFLFSKIALYQGKYGHPPETLHDLVPEFMPSVPGVNMSLFGDHRFHYIPEGPTSIWYAGTFGVGTSRPADGPWRDFD